MYLYLIRNTVNQKQYVGITTQPLRYRWQRHYSNAKTGGAQALARAIRKYGKEAFTVEMLAEAPDWDALLVMECAAIETYNTFAPTGHGYNLTRGGEGALGRILSEESRQKISLGKLGQPVSPETREAVGRRHRGVPKSPDQRQKMRDAQLGSKNHMYGKPLSDAHRQKLSDVRQGQVISETHLEAMVAAVRGKPKTEDHKQKLRESALERFADGHHPWVGREHSQETKAKISAATHEQFARQGNPMQGRTHSAETRRKMSERAKGRIPWNKETIQGPLSPEHRAKLSEAMRGQTPHNKGISPSQETREKMAEAHRGGKNGIARPIVLDGEVYLSIMDAVRTSGYTRMQITYRLKNGKATYFAPED
jgi:group I intron endonuclease